MLYNFSPKRCATILPPTVHVIDATSRSTRCSCTLLFQSATHANICISLLLLSLRHPATSMSLDRCTSQALEEVVAGMCQDRQEEELLESYAGACFQCVHHPPQPPLADLYAILKTTEKLERAYVRDDISAKDYEPACQKLIAQFRTLWETLRDKVPDVEQFMASYNMQCPMAAKRLIHSGLPATVEHGKPGCVFVTLVD